MAEQYPGQLIAPLRRSGMSRLNEWNASGRLDFTLHERHKVALRYVKARQTLDTLDMTTITPRNMQAHAGPVNAMASWDGVFGRLFQEFKVGLNRAPIGLLYTTPYGWLNDIGLLPGAQFADWMFGAVGRQAGGAWGRASDYRSRSFSMIDNLSWTKGAHNLKAGFEARDVLVPINLTGGSLYNFTTQGFIVNLGGTVAYAGDVHSGAEQRLFAGFLQDEWKARRNLTVNVGLRYEYYTPLHSSDGQARVFDMGSLSYLPAGSDFYRARTMGLAPRLGIAWAPRALRSRTILRWGGAVHYGPGQLRDLAGPVQNATTRFLASGMSFPADTAAARAAGKTLDNPVGIDATAKFPERVVQWGFSAQQVLPGRFTAQAGYLGQREQRAVDAPLGEPRDRDVSLRATLPAESGVQRNSLRRGRRECELPCASVTANAAVHARLRDGSAVFVVAQSHGRAGGRLGRAGRPVPALRKGAGGLRHAPYGGSERALSLSDG